MSLSLSLYLSFSVTLSLSIYLSFVLLALFRVLLSVILDICDTEYRSVDSIVGNPSLMHSISFAGIVVYLRNQSGGTKNDTSTRIPTPELSGGAMSSAFFIAFIESSLKILVELQNYI